MLVPETSESRTCSVKGKWFSTIRAQSVKGAMVKDEASIRDPC